MPIFPGNPFEESQKESLHEVSAGVGQIGNGPVNSGGSQHDGKKGYEDSAENGIRSECAAHVSIQTNRLSKIAVLLMTVNLRG